MRLDKYLVENGLVESRAKAQDLIKEGNVLINDKIIKKDSYNVLDTDNVKLLEVESYVSRGAYKLIEALNNFNIDVNNKVVLDVGASTGGFTDVLIKRGALKVYALDVGEAQLHPSLINNSKVINMEKTNILSKTFADFKDISLITIDVSFVSLKNILPHLFTFNTPIIALFKPQFEVGKIHMKNGVLKDEKTHKKLIKEFIDFVSINNHIVKDYTVSPILGRDGNKEYLFYII